MMIALRVATSVSRVSTLIADAKIPLFLRNNHNSINFFLLWEVTNSIIHRTFATETKDFKKMVDPKRVISYEDMLKLIHQPEKVIIDVRNPDEVVSTGKIPSSINIPLGHVQDALVSMSDADFKKQYQREKPSSSDELIFYCQSGRRSSEALDKALKLGYTKSKTYLGSWNDWSNRQK